MASWGEFEAAEADLAALGRRRLEEPGVVLVGTLRRDGWPRISPVVGAAGAPGIRASKASR